MTPVSGLRRGLAALGLAILQAGCSFVFVKAPPSSRRRAAVPEEQSATAVVDPPCTRWDAFWILDAVAAGAGAATGTIATLGDSPPLNETSEQRDSRRRLTMIAFYGGFLEAAVSGISAIWGFHTTHVCRRYLRQRGLPSNAWPWTKSLPPLEDPLHPRAD